MNIKNPYIGVWFDPKKTLGNIFTGKVTFRYYLPIILAAISLSFRVLNNNLLDDFSYDYLSFLISIGVGYLFIGHFFPWLIYKTGKIWKGISSLKQLQIVVSLSQIPAIIILVEQIVFLAFGEIKTYQSATIILQLVVWFFYIRALIIGVANVQKFSYGFALLNVIVCLLPFFILRLLLV